MKTWIGIDLGSTTTKAVVLDEQGAILGRGITNSRSNYDAACEVARREAYLDARRGLFAQRLSQDTAFSGSISGILDELIRATRLEQHLDHLDALMRIAREEGPGLGCTEEGALDTIEAGMRAMALDRHKQGIQPRSEFFRDVAGSDWVECARTLPNVDAANVDVYNGLFDKAILLVEALQNLGSTERVLTAALERALVGVETTPAEEQLLRKAIQEVCAVEFEETGAVGTGYGRARLPFPEEAIRSEILCHGLGAHASFPGTRTVLDIGGQDTKAIQVDEHGVVTSFQMNDRCAAGCGRYLGYIADEMNLGLHELGPLALKSDRPVQINSTCTVFAGAELRDRLAMGQSHEDILAGLHRAIVLRATGLLARSGGVFKEFTFTGGVANNTAAVAVLRTLVKENYDIDEINISPGSIYTGALGGALFAWREDHGLKTPQLMQATEEVMA
ncbi:MAG: BadF/BadG/BcrA/BcrD ATPase family protein [Planctomycetota bacterium]|jgi:benzoyl-CoA reductase subunit A|nr:BadF/BadG/BcrA/BcrD ATPase family protein [Planctomycetota bacterium]MDP6738903.1 BadF/BadG/BcrA/BcrD ATPase family protein [Planctomycetota bacterium]MDP6937209.1 BadF/BadG/BcrA/BcrD ATPase family protein [Planctomycetota bacterium]